MPDKEERIRERAYLIWEREGRLDGRHEHNWEEARREIEAEDAATGGSGDGVVTGKRSRNGKAAGSAGEAKAKSPTVTSRRSTPAAKAGAQKTVRSQAAETTINVLKRPRSKAD
jgi:Protein of unknown function (DUF2934)